jgi:hypothetical protein
VAVDVLMEVVIQVRLGMIGNIVILTIIQIIIDVVARWFKENIGGLVVEWIGVGVMVFRPDGTIKLIAEPITGQMNTGA